MSLDFSDSCFILLKEKYGNRRKNLFSLNPTKEQVLPGTLLRFLSILKTEEQPELLLERIDCDLDCIQVVCTRDEVETITWELDFLRSIPSLKERLEVFGDKEWLKVGEKLKPGDSVYVKIKDEQVEGIVKFKDVVPEAKVKGIIFGVELRENKGHTDGVFRDVRYFQTSPNRAVFTPLNKIQIRHDGWSKKSCLQADAEEKTFYQPEQSIGLLKLGERVVWISDEGANKGTVRWCGILPDEPGDNITVGVEFDEPIGLGTGKYKDKRLFYTRQCHAALIPLMELMREKDYNEIPSHEKSCLSPVSEFKMAGHSSYSIENPSPPNFSPTSQHKETQISAVSKQRTASNAQFVHSKVYSRSQGRSRCRDFSEKDRSGSHSSKKRSSLSDHTSDTGNLSGNRGSKGQKNYEIEVENNMTTLGMNRMESDQKCNSETKDCKKQRPKPSSRDPKNKILYDMLMPGLNVFLRLSMCCEDEDSVHENIKASFKDLLSSALQISFQETRLLFRKNETECHFILLGDTVVAKESLKSMGIYLKKELGVELNYHFEKIPANVSDDKNTQKSQDIIENLPNCRAKAYKYAEKISKQNAGIDQQALEKNSRKVQANLKAQIEEALSDIKIKRDEILENHKQKMSDIQRNIDMIKSKDDEFELLSQNDIQNKATLLQKLQELQLQKAEFENRSYTLYNDLRALDVSKATSKDVHYTLKCIGIECSRLSNALPIYARRKDIVKQVKSNQVSVILGETGSGKSTQMAQYLFEAGFAENGCIICTQPRRVAATTLADRVANEMIETIGGLVGYKVSGGRKDGKETKLIFTTDHSLLNECLKDPDLKQYSCIIVDEAHERSIYTDILLGMIKICLRKRPELKVIITSATIDPAVFIKYFNSGPELRVSGRTFPVDLFYTEDAQDDFENYEEKAVSKAVEIHSKKGPGDILVFLSSPVEIMRCCEEFERRCQGKTNFKCFPLHGQLQPDEQKKVFEKLPANERKIVFATNCAETSITIDGIKYVIDTGVVKEMKYDPRRNMSQLGIHAISKSSAEQRKGRAGRTASGKCYRLYSKDSFEAMESINDPEILRVHLGQAVLKLFELGVNIKCYDFVQAPSESALNSAIDNLEYLGAIADNQITDMGRWISKMPFDPKLGYVVYKAEKIKFLYDAVVLASVVSSGTDLFFRGFSETEAQIVAKSKMYFGSEYGDTFTWLQVYKAWSGVSEKERSSWCRSHCINSKCISFARQCIKDIKIILSRELKTEMVQEFSTETNDIDKLRKLLFEAYADSISNYSEVSRAGYFSLVSERQVHVHPSSILKAMNLQPEWLVYTNLMKTSQEFVKGITVVKEEWVKELVDIGKLSVDIEKAKQNKFNRVHREEVGPSVFRALVGPRFSNLSNIEVELQNSGLSRSILEATRDLGIFDIHSPYSMNHSALQIFSRLKSQVTEKLMNEDNEFNLNKKESIVSSGTRVVIGQGGCVKNILMPDQSDKVIVKRTLSNVTEEDIINKFGAFGEIKEIIQFKSKDPWGFVRYGSITEAVAAVDATCNDEANAGMLKLDRYAKNIKNMFEVKLTWIRRPIRGRGTSFIKKLSPLDMSSLVGKSIWLMGKAHTIKPSKRENELVIFNTGSTTENEVKDEVMNLLQLEGIRNRNVEISVSRENVPLDEKTLKTCVDCITLFIKNYMKEDSFKVNLLTPKQGSIYYVCFVNFVDPVKGYDVCKNIRQSLMIGGYYVDVNPCLKTIVHVSQKIKEVCEVRFNDLFSGLAQHKATELSWRKLKKDFAIEIKASKPENIVAARDLICKEMEGEVIDCSVNNILQCLLNKPGQEHLQKIENNNNCAIITDFRNSKIHLYGSQSTVSKTQQDINSYLTDIEGSEQGFFTMRGNNKPHGLMKLTMLKFGPLLDGLVEEFKLKSVSINWKKHNIQLLGSEIAVGKAIQHLLDLENEAWKTSKSIKDTYMPDCSVCMCPIETKEMLLRLEVCGHAYCRDCLKHQVTFAVNNKEFPLTCAGYGCDSHFVFKDIKFALQQKWIQENKLVSMSVNAFVTENKDKYKYCLTPNCSIVYKVTTDENGCEFNCPLCFASICTTCHIAFHAGLTCTMAKSGARAESELSAWVEMEPEKRKLCPGCHCPVEKTEGCNKMHCSSCRTYFCWLCLEVSSDAQDCYRHLQKVHGGFN